MWSSLAELLGHVLRGLQEELPGSLGLAVGMRQLPAAATELEVVAATGTGIILAPAQIHRYGGPIVDAARTGEVVRTDDLWADPRWPRLTRDNLVEHAPEQRSEWERLAGAVAVPGEWESGALVLSASLAGPVDDRAVALLTRREPIVRAALGMAGSVTDTRQHAEDTLEALRARVIIEQAKGLIIAARRCSADEAWATLRRASQEFNVKLRELAAALVEHVGTAPAEQPAIGEPVLPGAAARQAATLAWQALSLPNTPADADEPGPPATGPQRDDAPPSDASLPQLGMLRIDPYRSGTGLRLAGEIDPSVHDRWTTSLNWVTRHGRDVYLDMAELQFIDGRGVAILVAAARALPKGRWMVLHRPPPVLRRVLDLLWPEGESTIAIKDERQDKRQDERQEQ